MVYGGGWKAAEHRRTPKTKRIRPAIVAGLKLQKKGDG
jgi:hypothetical protein